jgi:hypothetical protein
MSRLQAGCCRLEVVPAQRKKDLLTSPRLTLRLIVDPEFWPQTARSGEMNGTQNPQNKKSYH